MSTINDSDLLLVERNGNLHQITYDQMSTLNDDDILLVERGGVQYKVEAQYVSTGPNGVILPSVEVLTPLNGSGLNDGQSYTPMSSAYVSTDTTPITYRHFPELITTVSGGSWVDENKMFNGSQSYFSELTGAAGVVSQAVFTPQTGWTEAQTTVWAYVTTGGTVEVLDENDTVLRSYALLTSFQEVGNDIGIVRADQKIRFSTNNQNESLFISRISGAPTDYYINGRVAFEFADDTDLDKMVAPIIQVDETGNVKVPTTSTVDSTTTIPGENKDLNFSWTGNSTDRNIQKGQGYGQTPGGPRMVWAKTSSGYQPTILDNVALGDLSTSSANNHLLWTSETHGKQSAGDVVLADGESNYGPNSNYYNRNGSLNFIYELGVAPGILDIVPYVGNGSNIHELSHNLGTKPGMIIVKNLDTSTNWLVWHKDIHPDEIIYLNQDGTPGSGPAYFPSQPTKDKFYVGKNYTASNANGYNYVAYVFPADSPGKVKCGLYNGSSGNQGISCGFNSGFALVKNVFYSANWSLATSASTSNNGKYWDLNSNSSPTGSLSGNNTIETNSNQNGFICKGNGISYNNSNSKYIYLAIANEITGPNSTQLNLLSGQDLEYFTTGTPITSNSSASGSNISFGSVIYGGNSSPDSFGPPSVDNVQNWFDIRSRTGNKGLVWIKSYDSSYRHILFDTERNYNKYLQTNGGQSESSYSTGTYIEPYRANSYMTGYYIGNSDFINRTGSNYIAWNFLAAPQFFDVQKYVGTGSVRTIQHDLGVEPGCIIIKRLDADNDWRVYHSELTSASYQLYLNYHYGENYAGPVFNSTDPTSSEFTVGSDSAVNANGGIYVAYLFAKDTPYVKCGSYTATGGVTTVDVGFQARWILTKSKTANEPWGIFDKKLQNKYLIANEDYQQQNGNWSTTSTQIRFDGSYGVAAGGGNEYIYIAIADESEGHPPSPPSTSTVTETPDPNTAQMVVNAESFDVGATASAPALEASITSLGGVDGNKLLVDGSTGTWMPGLYAKGSETTINAPGPDEITFTSQNQGTPTFSGVDATLASRTWTLESGTTATGPWTLVDTYVDYDVLNSQTGATPWTSNKPNLTPNTFYRVKVQYNSTNAESVESVYNTFKTGDA